MRFCDKINLLMQIYRMTNVTLARGVGVTPSLVSRWRSGERVPPKILVTAGDIGAFLAGAPILPSDRDTLIHTLGSDLSTREKTEEVIAAWIAAENIVTLKTVSPEPEVQRMKVLGNAGMLVRQMARILDVAAPGDVGSVNVWPFVQKGNPAEHEVFLGEKGKRLAVMAFLHAAQGSARAMDIFLLLGQNQSWITNDPVFMNLWERSLLLFLQKGHNLHIAVPEEYGVSAVEAWQKQSIFFSSRCRLYAVKTGIAETLLVARGYAVALSYGELPPQEITLLFRGIADTSVYESVFHSLLKDGYPLTYSCDTTELYTERLTRQRARDGACYVCANTLSAIFMNEEDITALLTEKSVPERRGKLQMLAKNRASLAATLQYHRYIQILPTGVIDAASKGKAFIRGYEVNCDVDFSLPREMICGTLKNMLNIMESNDNFHLILIDTETFPVEIEQKPGVGAFFTTVGGTDNTRPRAVYAGQKDELEKLEDWFTSHNYARGDVINHLRSAICLLERN